MDFVFHIKLPYQSEYPIEFDRDYALGKAQNAINYCFNLCDIEIRRRAKLGILDIESFAVFINELIQPYGDRFFDGDKDIDETKSNFIKGLRTKYLTYLNLIYLQETYHFNWFYEVLEFGKIHKLQDQLLWHKHWQGIVESYENFYELSINILN